MDIQPNAKFYNSKWLKKKEKHTQTHFLTFFVTVFRFKNSMTFKVILFTENFRFHMINDLSLCPFFFSFFCFVLHYFIQSVA